MVEGETGAATVSQWSECWLQPGVSPELRGSGVSPAVAGVLADVGILNGGGGGARVLATVARGSAVDHIEFDGISSIFCAVVVDGDFFTLLDIPECSVFLHLTTGIVVAGVG